MGTDRIKPKMPRKLTEKPAGRAADAQARDFGARMLRLVLVILGAIVVVVGILMAPLPGPFGIPVIVVGLMLTLRNSFKARRQFVRFQYAHPKMIAPIRRLLRRDPELLKMIWQHLLRIERSMLAKDKRMLRRMRRALGRRR